MPATPVIHCGHAALRKGRSAIPHGIYLITTVTRQRAPLFRDFPAACHAARSFESPALLGGRQLLAWVLMPDHAHWLLQLGDSDSLATVVNRLKSASARHVNSVLQRTGSLWAPSFHDHAVRADEALPSLARYIVANPLRAKLVERVGDYPFWNAIWLANDPP